MPRRNEFEDYPPTVDRGSSDPALQSIRALIEMTGELEMSIGIVLIVPGGTLRGLLVNQAEWYQEWFQGMASAGRAGQEISDVLRKTLTAAGMLTADGAVVDHFTEYLHIRNGTLHSAGGSLGPMPWRIRLESVAGWSLGAPAPA